MKTRYSTKFFIKKRKDENGDLIDKNMQIYMLFSYEGKKLQFYIGYRVNFENFITSKDSDIQSIRKNTFSDDRIPASVINARMQKCKDTIEAIYTEMRERGVPSPSELLAMVRTEMDEIQNKSIKNESSIVGLYEKYINDADLSNERKRQNKSDKTRVEQFIKLYNKSDVVGLFDEVSIVQFEKFLFYYSSDNKEMSKIKQRSSNTVATIESRVKSFHTWLVKNKFISKNPFFDAELQKGKYAEDVISLSKQEFDFVYSSKVEDKNLERCRDQFCLQCLIGCRVSDLRQITENNIEDGVLTYYPKKTLKDGVKVSVPLSVKAISLIEKYRGMSQNLMPLIWPPLFNQLLKILFEKLEMNRSVYILDGITGNPVRKYIYEVVSSHMARRTFIDILYQAGVSIDVISSMSGHSPRSKAFERYKNTPADLKKKAIANFLD